MPISHITNPQLGLDPVLVSKKLIADGYNESPNQKARTIFKLILELVSEPMILLLVIGSLVYFLIGEAQDAFVLTLMIFVIIGITIVQERKSEKALEALKEISSPKSYVVRGGKQIQVPTREIVTGDIVILREGDRVPADGFIIESTNISIDESLLTGESVPVYKFGIDGQDDISGSDSNNQTKVFAGTLVVKGYGKAQISATGIRSEIGKIGNSLLTITEARTNLQNEIRRVVKLFAVLAFLICTIVVLSFGLMQSNWLDGILTGITLSMTLLPEEFPVVLTIFMTLGALRMSRKHVLTRNTKVIETLGAANVLCVDKTGTLTENRMRISQITTKDKDYILGNKVRDIPQNIQDILNIAKMASQQNGYDPMDKAIHVKTENYSMSKWQQLREYPFTPKLLATVFVWQQKGVKKALIAAKGAPEHIFKLCKLDKQETGFWLKKVTEMAASGQRVLAVANAVCEAKNISQSSLMYEYNLVGLIGFVDPIKPDIKESVSKCHKAGVRVIMITGDYPATAMYVASQIGIAGDGQYVTGSDISTMSRLDLLKKIAKANVFCRIIPEQKLRIVQLLKSDGNIVAMTGDGINDAPALKAADIGIAMGKRGTDVAKESSDLIILDDNFVSIVAAIRMGRRIYNNIKKALSYVVAMHMPIASLALLPVILGLPPVLLPIHVAFLELVIDPACTTIFESEKENDQVMKKPPRHLNDTLFNRRTIRYSLLQGFGLILAVYCTYFLSHYIYALSDPQVRAATFVTLVCGNLALISTNRSWSKTVFQLLSQPNKAYWLIVIPTFSVLLLSVFIQRISAFFHFDKIPTTLFAVSVFLGLTHIWWFELRKILLKVNRKYFNFIS